MPTPKPATALDELREILRRLDIALDAHLVAEVILEIAREKELDAKAPLAVWIRQLAVDVRSHR
jgi:hypothetical protein